MERCGHSFALAHNNRIAACGAQHLDLRSQARELGRSNENHLDGSTAEHSLANRAIDLPTVGVATNTDVKSSEAALVRIFHFFCQKNCARARAKRRFHANEIPQLLEPGFAEKLKEGARFASRNYQSVNFV